jgi:hypothetical protein
MYDGMSFWELCKLNWEQAEEEVHLDSYFEGNATDWPTPSYAWHYWIAFMFADLVYPLICKRFGHDYEYYSEADGDSGGEGFHCNRCHHDVWHQYY